MFTGLMKSWNPSLGSLDPQFENDMKSFQTAIINGNKDEVERLINKWF